MDLLKIKRVQSSRDTGVGMWVQELCERLIPFLFPPTIFTIRSMEGLLHTRHVCVATGVDGQAVPGKVRGCQMGSERRTL